MILECSVLSIWNKATVTPFYISAWTTELSTDLDLEPRNPSMIKFNYVNHAVMSHPQWTMKSPL